MNQSSKLLYAIVAVYTVWMPIAGASSISGSILVTDTTQFSPVLTTYAPISAPSIDSNAGSGCFAASYDECLTYLDQPSFGGQVTQVQVIDDTTGLSSYFPYSSADPITGFYTEGFFFTDVFSDPLNPGHVGAQVSVGISGADVYKEGQLLISFTVVDYQGYIGSGGQCGLAAPCLLGPITGAVQNAFTINYLDANQNVLGSDTESFQGQGVAATAPEPASLSLLISGLGLLVVRPIRKKLRLQ